MPVLTADPVHAAPPLEALRDAAEQACALMKVLGNPDRLMLLCELAQGERSVTQLQEALGIGIGHLRDLGLGDPEAGDRHGHHALPLADPRRIQLGAELLAQRFRLAGVDVLRKFGLESGQLLEAFRRPSQQGALDPPALPGKAQHGRGSLAGPGSQFQKVHHGWSWGVSALRSTTGRATRWATGSFHRAIC